MHLLALLLSLIAFVPLDNRPVTLQLPVLLGRIAGVKISTPPRAELGDYLQPGVPGAAIDWLNGPSNSRAGAIVISSDMLAYGGLVASRTPATPYDAAYFRIRSLAQTREAHPSAWIAAFGTVMRLAPTGIPAIGDAASYFAAGPAGSALQKFANLHDPPLPSEAADAARWRAQAGSAFDGYMQARARDYGIDRYLIALAAGGTLDRLVIGQDDAGPVGLHVKEVSALQAAANATGAVDRISIEPGADELGMVLVAHALARRARWIPRIAVVYSTPQGAQFQDPLEFAPISNAIDHLISLCGGVEDEADPDIVLMVRVPYTPPGLDDAFVTKISTELTAHRSVALADLTFMEPTYVSQAAFANRILDDGIASKLDAYASWNTNANTVGTALAEAVAAGAGRRAHTYSQLAHREFTFMRFADDFIFHTSVRPDLNATLDNEGVRDHTYLLPAVAATIAELNRALLWNQSAALLTKLYPGEHIAAMQITLPWNRTFETRIDVRLAPNIGV